MSRLDLNGLRPNRIDVAEDDFEFGVLPEDESDPGPLPCEDIDAINTETFGDDIEGVDYDDLEVYSKQTAGLKLEDGTSFGWENEPSCSISAPDPSQLPDPTFDSSSLFPNSRSPIAAYDTSGSPYSSSFELNLGTVDSLFSNNVRIKNYSVWGPPDLSSVITRSAMNFINKTEADDGSGDHVSVTQSQKDPTTNNAGNVTVLPKKPGLAKIPKDALTLEELEKQQLQETKAKKLPEVPQGAIALEDLEKQFASPVTPKVESKPLDVSVPSEVKGPMTPQFPLSPQPPLSFPMLHPMMHPYMLNYRARMAGQLMDGPGFPMMPPQMRMAFLEAFARNANTVGGFRYPFPPQMPGMPMPRFPSLIPGSCVRINNVHPSASSRVFFPHNQGHSTNKNGIYREPQFKKTGLPSAKTISDFAFDPYAGFMSKKEREWLIKIQVLQCQGTGNLFDDDFYYTAWKERKFTMEKNAKDVVVEKNDSDVHTTSSNPYHYVPPTFAGSLGKPSLSTVNNPRQLIDLRCDGFDEDDRSNTKGSSQKRFRALLMMIENIAAYVLACEDRRRQLVCPVIPEDLRGQLEEEVQLRLEALCNCFTSDKISTIITLNKGRQMFVRTFALLDSNRQLLLFNAFLRKSLTSALKTVADEELLHSLLPSFISYLSQCPKEDLVKIFDSFVVKDVLTLASNLSNKFLCHLVLAILLCLSRKHVDLSVDCGSSALFAYLCDRKHLLKVPEKWSTTIMIATMIDEKDLVQMRQWLQKQFQRLPGSVGLQLGLSI